MPGLKGDTFKGTDDLRDRGHREARPDYQPWFQPLWKPPERARSRACCSPCRRRLGAGVPRRCHRPSQATRQGDASRPIGSANLNRWRTQVPRGKGPVGAGHAADRRSRFRLARLLSVIVVVMTSPRYSGARVPVRVWLALPPARRVSASWPAMPYWFKSMPSGLPRPRGNGAAAGMSAVLGWPDFPAFCFSP